MEKQKTIFEVFEVVKLNSFQLQQIIGGGTTGETEDIPVSNPPPGNP